MAMEPLLKRFTALLLILCVFPLWACAYEQAYSFARNGVKPPSAVPSQKNPPPDVARVAQPPSTVPSQKNPPPDEPTFRVHVRLVNIFATVTDSHGAPVA